MKIYIIRHGETKGNEEGRLQGWVDTPLNEMGIRLAEETGAALKGIHFDAAYSSHLSRARRTAEIILRCCGDNTEIIEDDRIKELGMGIYENRRLEPDTPLEDLLRVKKFLTNPLNEPAFPEGESARQVMARTQEFLRELAEKNYETVLVATHGCALRCMLNFLYDDPSDFWHGGVPLNCCINIVEAKNGELRLTEDDLILYDKSLCVDRYAAAQKQL